jgi:hypothetical protein
MKHLLEALECPFVSSLPTLEKLTVKDQTTIICWLEDRVIREFDIADREFMRPNHEKSVESVGQYLHTLGCPYNWTVDGSINNTNNSNMDALYWITSYAVNLKYEDETTNTMETEEEEESEVLANTVENNDEIMRLIDSIGGLLQVTRNEQENNTGRAL